MIFMWLQALHTTKNADCCVVYFETFSAMSFRQKRFILFFLLRERKWKYDFNKKLGGKRDFVLARVWISTKLFQISSMGDGFVRLTQTVFAPWTLPGERFSATSKSDVRQRRRRQQRRRRRYRQQKSGRTGSKDWTRTQERVLAWALKP